MHRQEHSLMGIAGFMGRKYLCGRKTIRYEKDIIYYYPFAVNT